ncbi:MAG TPA: SusC/RagA family TonB-linked outer membrane protein [Gemmatirosa sp.]
MVAAAVASAQRIRVTGTVSAPGGGPIVGASVRVVGVDSAVLTNSTGRYSISAPTNGTLAISFVGFTRYTTPIEGRTTINVTMSRLTLLEQVVVTSGYGGDAQRRSEITGAVASVDVAATQRQTSASVLERLDASVSGVNVNASGSPGARATVRIRGISSFQNNDPLYIIDGTPVQDTYANWLNPEDIASIQVLKDASAASIYGSRASNGVIIIETNKRGASGPPRVRVRANTGVATPVNGYDKFLLNSALDYFQVVKQSYLNAGYPLDTIQTLVYGRNLYGDPNNPQVPKYTYCGSNTTCTNVNTSNYQYPNNLIMPGSAGTDWWKAVFGSAQTSNVNLDVSGGGAATAYAVSFNYFDQGGTAAYNYLRRGSVRANTSFTRGKLTVGENAAFTLDRSAGGLAGDAYGETSILGKNILMQPVVSIYDINGNFASGKAVGLGNNSNPLKLAYAAKDNTTNNGRVFGNVFGNVDLTPSIALRTQLGGNLVSSSYNQLNPATPENSEPTGSSGYYENSSQSIDWTWSNTARFSRKSGDHSLSVLVGQEINETHLNYAEGSVNGLISTSTDARYIQDALGDASTKAIYTNGDQSALLSFFGKADYTYADRYTANFTVRRDGSSRLGPEHRWGTFPAVGLGWHLTNESFFQPGSVVSDAQVRIGYGITGNQQIPAGRVVDQFGGTRNQTYYNITGSNSNSVVGYRLISLGNPDLKWEENRSVNAGTDVAFFHNNLNVVLDVYNRTTNNLLFAPATPGTAGAALPPFVNIGEMRNRGYDFSVGHRDRNWSLSFNGSHYNNKILRIDGGSNSFFSPASTRIGTFVINQVGDPIGSFYGYQADGYFRDSADVKNSPAQDGAAPGRIKFKDVNGDGKITLADRTIIGSPHPKFTGGLDGEIRRGRFDLGATLFGTFGNKIFDAQKDFYVFQDFETNVRNDLLKNSWTPTNLNAKYPRLDVNDTYSRAPSSYYVENGSYVRLRSVQLGYTLPTTGIRFLPGGSRIYVQAENLFTITGYDGLDPSLPAAGLTTGGGTGGIGALDQRDLFRGVDTGVYPSSRTFSIGITTSF